MPLPVLRVHARPRAAVVSVLVAFVLTSAGPARDRTSCARACAAGIEATLARAPSAVERTACFDFLVGLGRLDVPGGDASFGLVAGLAPGAGAPGVRLTYSDHARGMRVEATSILVYEPGATPGGRRFGGACTIDGLPGFGYAIEVEHGAPVARGRKVFSVRLSNGYSARGALAAGNVLLFDSCP